MMNQVSNPTELENQALEAFKEIIEQAKKMFLEDGELVPAIFIGQNLPKGTAFIVMDAGPFMKTVADKDKLAALMKSVCKAEPLCICLVTEVWMVKGDKSNEKELTKIAPSEHPDRIEALMFSFESENLQTMFAYEIKRESGLSLQETSESGSMDSMKGRFAGMLKDMKKIKWN